MKFKRVCTGWKTKTMTQEQAADLPGVSARTFRRYIYRYTEDGLDGLYDNSTPFSTITLLNRSPHKAPDVFSVYYNIPKEEI